MCNPAFTFSYKWQYLHLVVKMNLTVVLSWLSDEERGKFASEHKLYFTFRLQRDSLVAEIVKNLPIMQETQVWPLHWEDPLEKG